MKRREPWPLLVAGLALSLTAACDNTERESSTPRGASDIDALRALGYVGVSEERYEDDESGVVLFDEERSAPGYNLYTNRYLCSAILMDAQGREVQRWERPDDRAWSNAQLLANGDLLVIGHERHEPYLQAVDEHRYVLRLSWNGEELWRSEVNAHHDLEVTPDGDLAVLGFERALGTRFTPPDVELRRELLHLLDLETGASLAQRSLVRTLRSRPELLTLRKVVPTELEAVTYADLIHANSVEFLGRPEHVGRHPLYDLGNVLVCSRNQDLVFSFEWQSGDLIWCWGRDELSGPHDAQVLEDGNLLIFDNGLGRGWSRVIELNPVNDEIVWEYQATPPEAFYTASRGSAQRLPNGNTLVAESDEGRAFEVTPDGTRVWTWINPARTSSGEAITIVRMKRLPLEYVRAILER